jgi:hypothetical protein
MTPLRACVLSAAFALARAQRAPLAAGFVITVSDNTTSAFNDAGLAFSSPNASDVISRAIAALPYPGGGTVLLRAGAYYLDAPIAIERCSVTLRGESKGGDLYFSSDGTYHGYRNKSGVTLVAPATDAIVVGATMLALGITIENLLITGTTGGDDGALPRAGWTRGAGVRAARVDTFQLASVAVLRKEFGVQLGPDVAPFAYDRVMDVVSLDNVYLAFNQWGVYAQQWVCNVRLRNIFGYLNEYSLIYKSGTIGQYDWVVSGVSSQGDGWMTNATAGGAVIHIVTGQQLVLRDIDVAASTSPDRLCAAPLIEIVLEREGPANETEWYSGTVLIDHATLASSQTDAVRVSGTGRVDVRALHAGSTGSQAFAGGAPLVNGSAVNVVGAGADVTVDGGFAGVAGAEAFAGVRRVANVRGYNPRGTIARAWDTARARVGPGGAEAAPAAGAVYYAFGVDLFVVCGAGAAYSWHAPGGGAAAAVGACTGAPIALPVGFGISFDFSSPTNFTVVGN